MIIYKLNTFCQNCMKKCARVCAKTNAQCTTLYHCLKREREKKTFYCLTENNIQTKYKHARQYIYFIQMQRVTISIYRIQTSQNTVMTSDKYLDRSSVWKRVCVCNT